MLDSMNTLVETSTEAVKNFPPLCIWRQDELSNILKKKINRKYTDKKPETQWVIYYCQKGISDTLQWLPRNAA